MSAADVFDEYREHQREMKERRRNGNGNVVDFPAERTRRQRGDTEPERLRRELTPIYPAGVEHRDVVDDALGALRAANKPERIFVHGGALTRLQVDEQGRPRLDAMNDEALRVELIHAASFRKRTTSGDVLIDIPRYVLPSLLHLPDWTGIPPIEAIVETPVLRADGTLLDQPGYDAASRLYYHPTDGLEIPTVTDSDLTQERARDALAYVQREALGDFPFASPADEANALALMLTPLVRMGVPVVPLALITAPVEGTGKGLLVDVVSILARGMITPVYDTPEKEDELRKGISGQLFGGSTFITLDEVTQLRSKKLASALTASLYEDRELGRSRMIRVPQRATWVANGNNVEVIGDLDRRSYRIRIDAKCDRPWERTGWRHQDLRVWVKENRGVLLAGLLTAARAWIAAGRPPASVPVLGSFEQWAKTVGGILAFAGVDGFLANQSAHYDAASEAVGEWEDFLDAVARDFQNSEEARRELKGTPWATRELARAIKHGLLRDELPSDLAPAVETPTFSTSLGVQLKNRIDRRHGDRQLRVVRASEAHNKQPRWLIVEG